jgi:hypothetical protein
LASNAFADRIATTALRQELLARGGRGCYLGGSCGKAETSDGRVAQAKPQRQSVFLVFG